MRLSHVAAAAAALLATTIPAGAGAQASNYPSFQVPRISTRDYNFAFASGAHNRSLLFQWREGWTTTSQFSLDAGVSDYNNRVAGVDVDYNTLFVGGQYAQQLAKATADVPLDFMFTVGANVGLFTGDQKPADALIRIPLGVVVGRRIPLEQSFAITPYVHPRASLDFLPGTAGDNSAIAVNFDVGADFELSPRLSVRASALLGDDDAFGVSLAFTPAALTRR